MPTISQSRSGEEMFPVVQGRVLVLDFPRSRGRTVSAFPSQSRAFCRIACPTESSTTLNLFRCLCSTNGRAIAIVAKSCSRALTEPRKYSVTMIDNGYCFNGVEWTFPNLPKGGLSPRPSAYETVRGIDAFEAWIQILEAGAGMQLLDHLADESPHEWYQHDAKALRCLLGDLNRRRHHVRALLYTSRSEFPQCFPNWVNKHSSVCGQLVPSQTLWAKAKNA